MSGSQPTFADYRLHEVISSDAVSTVYRATRSDGAADTPPVALRVTHPSATNDAELLAAFLRRASAAAGLYHPAVVHTLDLGRAEDRAFVATELVAGTTTLGDLVATHGPLPPPVAIALLRDVADGLDAAHLSHVVHGAIGPHTIWVTPSGDEHRALITGFGLDVLLRQQSPNERDRAASDDLLYVAPEQLRGRQFDSRADQYALACALYHCVTGQPPFVRESAAALFGAHLFAQPSLVEPVFSDNAHLRRALVRGMAKEPLDRYPSCWHLIHNADPTAFGVPAAPVAVDAAGPAEVDASASAVPSSTAMQPPPQSRDPQHDFARGSSQRSASTGGRRRWLPWSMAAVLVGVIATVVLAAMLRDGDIREAPVAREVEQPSPQPTPPVVAAARATPEPQTRIAWERTVGDEAIGHLAAVGDAVVAATDNGVVTLEAQQGTARWQSDVDVGILTDMVATDDVVVYRGATLRALSTSDGAERWDNATRLAPTGSLAATSDIIYGMGPGRIVPELMAVDPGTGEELWHFHGEEVTVDQRAAVAPTEDMVAILQNGNLFGLDPRGELAPSGADRVEVDEETWRVEIDDPWVQSLVFPEGGEVIYGTQKGRVCALDPSDGDESWCTYIEALRDAEPRLLVESDAVVVVTPRQVVALGQADGAKRWTFDAAQRLTSVADVTPSDVVVMDGRGNAHALALDSGEQRWRSDALGDVSAIEAVEDAVYVGTENGVVLSVRPTADAG
jgi:serine/threonine protein kinase/outer membrane protein assembly factor BamB